MSAANPFSTIETRHPAAARALAVAFSITLGTGSEAVAQLSAALRFHKRLGADSTNLVALLNGSDFAAYRGKLGVLDPSRMSHLRALANEFLSADTAYLGAS